MAREQRSESLDSIVTDDSEDPLTCPLTQRLFHDPVILVASGVTYEASALEECLRRAPDMDPKTGERFELPAVTAPNLAGGYGEPAGLGLSAASLPYDGGSPYA